MPLKDPSTVRIFVINLQELVIITIKSNDVRQLSLKIEKQNLTWYFPLAHLKISFKFCEIFGFSIPEKSIKRST